MAIAAETSRHLPQTGTSSFWCASLPVPSEVGAGVWGDGGPTFAHHSILAPHLPGKLHFLWGIPGHGAPHPVPTAVICTANSSPFPGSA